MLHRKMHKNETDKLVEGARTRVIEWEAQKTEVDLYEERS